MPLCPGCILGFLQLPLEQLMDHVLRGVEELPGQAVGLAVPIGHRGDPPAVSYTHLGCYNIKKPQRGDSLKCFNVPHAGGMEVVIT